MAHVFSKHIKGIAAFVLAVSLLLSTEGFSDGSAPAGSKQKSTWLFVQLASSGTLDPIEGTDNQYTLTLKGVFPSMISFTNRPGRTAHITMVKDFVAEWEKNEDENNYKKNPPNAALALSIEGLEDIIVFRIEDPLYDAAKETLTYKVTHIALVDQRSDRNYKIKIRLDVPKTFNQCALFVDDAWGSLGG